MSKRKDQKSRRSVQSVSRGLTNMSSIRSFRLVDGATTPTVQNTNGSGVAAGFANADPSGGSGSTWTAAEWSNLITLYSQVRLVEFKVHIFPAPGFDSKLAGDLSNYLVISSVLSSVSTAPTSAHSVFDNADAKLWTPYAMTTGKPITHTLRPAGRPQWAVVTSPNPGSFAGCPGSIQWYTDLLPVSQLAFLYLVEGIYEFRSRI